MNSGFVIHCHHNILVEYCYNYEERVQVIKRDKPLSEQEIRLRLFKILPEEALKDIPRDFRVAEQKLGEAYRKVREVEQAGRGTHSKWKEINREWHKADQEQHEALEKWGKVEQEIFHKTWCGCKRWNNREIVFVKDT